MPPVISFKQLDGTTDIPSGLVIHSASAAAGVTTTPVDVVLRHNHTAALTNVSFFQEQAASYSGAATAAADLAEFQAGSWLQINQNSGDGDWSPLVPNWVAFTASVGITSNRIALLSGSPNPNGSTLGYPSNATYPTNSARIQLRIVVPLTVATVGVRQTGLTVAFTYS